MPGLLRNRCRMLSPRSRAQSALAASGAFLALVCLAGAATDLACTCTCCAGLGVRLLAVRTCSAAFRACHAEISTTLYHVAFVVGCSRSGEQSRGKACLCNHAMLNSIWWPTIR